jgi:hypothetical protein
MKTTLFAVCLAVGTAAHGAVIYTGTKLPFWKTESESPWGNVHSIDIDGDGTRDFFTSDFGGALSLFPSGTNRILSYRATLPDLGWSVTAMDGGELIGSAPSFGEFLGLSDRVNSFHYGEAFIYLCNGRGPIGQPEGCLSVIEAGNRVYYLGVEFSSSDVTHYGWISVSAWFLTSQHWIDVNGWAYDTEPNQAILAGAIPEPSTTAFIAGSLFLLWKRKRRGRADEATSFLEGQSLGSADCDKNRFCGYKA